MRTTFGKMTAPVASPQRPPRREALSVSASTSASPQQSGSDSAANGVGGSIIAALLVVLAGLILLIAMLRFDFAPEWMSELLGVALVTVSGGVYWLADTLGLTGRRSKNSSAGSGFGLLDLPDGDSCDAGGDGGGD